MVFSNSLEIFVFVLFRFQIAIKLQKYQTLSELKEGCFATFVVESRHLLPVVTVNVVPIVLTFKRLLKLNLSECLTRL